jgi:hypothetical protein
MAKGIDFKRLGMVITADVTAESEAEYKAFVFDVFGEVIQRTPVDTGQARRNWHIQIDTPNYSTGDDNASELKAVDTKGFPDVYISNGLSYIEGLDEGRSSQAPNGITQPALAAVRSRR